MGGPSCLVLAGLLHDQPPSQPHWPQGPAGRWGAWRAPPPPGLSPGATVPEAPAGWSCRWRPHPPQPASSSPEYLGPGVISFLASCPWAKAQGGGFVWAAASLGWEGSSGIRQNCRFGFFTVF